MTAHLGPLDVLVFLAYFLVVVFVGFWVAAHDKRKTAEEYSLARRRLPWYAIGSSFIASNISTEHFIGMVGWGYLYGFAVAHWEWANFITFFLLIWVFLPFYMRGSVETMTVSAVVFDCGQTDSRPSALDRRESLDQHRALSRVLWPAWERTLRMVSRPAFGIRAQRKGEKS
jgi:hypothetical protein